MGIDSEEKPSESSQDLFKGVKYYVVGEISSEVMSLLEKHGAKRDSYLSEMVSHVIAESAESDDYSEAKELFELPIVTSDWVTLSVLCGKQLPKEAFALEGQLFSKVVACPSDLEEEDILAIWGMIVYHGGKCQLHLDNKVTHLITSSTDSPKYIAASESMETVKIVCPDWVVDSVDKEEIQEETAYHPRLIEYPKPESPPLPPEPNLATEEAMDTSPVATSPVGGQGLSGLGQFEQIPGDDRMEISSPDTPNAKEALARKISSRIYSKTSEPTTPEKSVPSMFHPISSPGVASGVRHTSPIPAMGLQPRMETSPNIRNTLRNITNRAATPLNVPLRSSLPTGAAKINPVLNMGLPHPTRPPPPDYPFPRMTGPMPASTTTTPSSQAPPPNTSTTAPSGPQYYGHDPKENVPTNACLLGCIFLIVDYQSILGNEEVVAWKKVIEQHGGQVESSYSNRITHIMCSNQKSEMFRMALKEGKRIVTAYWLNDCLVQKKMVPPWQALHLPLSFNSEKPGFNQMISVTNFDGEERTRLKQMINAIGAKYTGYMTHHNSALICKKPGGMKFEKAKEWRIAVVNVQWLSDLVLGHMEALRLPVHVRYLQVGQGREFHMDLNRVSHLLGGWKSPMKITKETWKKYAAGLISPSGQENTFSPCPVPPKRKKVDCSTPAPEVESCVPKVMFTLYPKSVVLQLTSIVKQLGGMVVSNPRHCTHLVCPNLARTIKFFIAISSTRYIVSKEWLEESVLQERFLAEGNYALKDEKGECDLGCNLAESLRLAQSRPLFQNISFYITPGVVPPICELASIIENAGGNIVKKRPSAKSIAASLEDKEKSKFIVITCLGDLHLSQDLRAKHIPIYNSELILTGVMRQELNLNLFRIAPS